MGWAFLWGIWSNSLYPRRLCEIWKKYSVQGNGKFWESETAWNFTLLVRTTFLLLGFLSITVVPSINPRAVEGAGRVHTSWGLTAQTELHCSSTGCILPEWRLLSGFSNSPYGSRKQNHVDFVVVLAWWLHNLCFADTFVINIELLYAFMLVHILLDVQCAFLSFWQDVNSYFLMTLGPNLRANWEAFLYCEASGYWRGILQFLKM